MQTLAASSRRGWIWDMGKMHHFGNLPFACKNLKKETRTKRGQGFELRRYSTSNANQEALSLFRRAIDLLADIPEDRPLATRLYESLGDSLVISGQLPEADAAYRSALAQCPAGDRLRLAALYQKLVHIYPPQGRMGESEAIYQKALEVLGPEPGPLPAVDWWRAWLDIQLSRYETLYYQGRVDEMEKVTRQVGPVLEQYGTPLQHVEYSGNQLMLTCRKKRFILDPADLAYAAEAVDRAPIDDEMKRAYHEFGLGFGYLWASLLPTANEYLLQSLAKAEAMAYLPLQDQCLAYLVIAWRLAGDVAQARLYHARSTEVAKRVGAPYYLGVAEANQAWLWFLDDHWDLAEASARRALQLWQDYVYPFHWLADCVPGLLAARTLRSHFTQVTILERDPVNDRPESPQEQPQTCHAHILLAGGLQILNPYFPDLIGTQAQSDAMVADGGEAIRWSAHGGYRRPFHFGLKAMTMSRPFLEHQVRRRVQALANVILLDSGAE